MADGRGMVWRVVAVVAVLAALGLGIALFQPGQQASVAGGNGQALSAAPLPETPSVCPQGSPETTTLTLTAVDEQNRGTVTAERHRVWVKDNGNWNIVGNVVDGGTTSTISPGNTIRVLWNENATEALGAGPYAKITEHVLPCNVGGVPLTEVVKDKNGTAITVTFFNDDDGLANANADEQAVAANGEANPEMQLRATSQDYYGDGNILVVFDMNTTAYEDIKIEHPDAVRSTTPRVHSSNRTGVSTIAWELPALFGTSNVRYTVNIEASGTEPTTSSDIPVTLYDKAVYLDADDDTPKMGYDDEDGNDVGAASIYQLAVIEVS